MRDIRFRAWCNGMVYGSNSNIFDSYYGQDPVMQFTGLTDKNGKEIYEGDVVKYRKHPQKTKIGEIAFTSYGAFAIKNQNELERERGFWTWTSFNGMNQLEVIGNVWENPELLEGKQ